MTEKRYYTHKHLLKENEVHDKICHRFMSIDETVEHMNNEYWKYKQLKKENEKLKSEIQKLKKENRLLEIEDENFKDCLIEFNKTKQNLNESKEQFACDVHDFMGNKGILVRVLFFGDTFGLDIKRNWDNMTNSPRKIPLNVLTEFCNTFGCEFEYTKCGGSRYIFSFDGLNMEY